MGLKDALGRAVKGILDATDCDGDYGDLKWRENHPHRVIGGPNWYGGKDMGGGHLPEDAIKADRAVREEMRAMSGLDKRADPHLGYPEQDDDDWKGKPDGA